MRPLLRFARYGADRPWLSNDQDSRRNRLGPHCFQPLLVEDLSTLMQDMKEPSLRRIVIDTNILVASAYNRTSASGQIVDAVARDEFQLITSSDIEREYDRILPRAIRIPGEISRLRAIITAGLRVSPPANPPVTEDREDDKFLAAAAAGSAEAVITNDPHLLSVDGYLGIRVLRPSDFLRSGVNDESSGPGGEEHLD